MDRTDLLRQLGMTYDDQITYLLGKYGRAKNDYFDSESCQRKNKISRTSEGLYCHHIREDVAYNLSDPRDACRNPFEYQKAENLVYCNILEHLSLHIKISGYGVVLMPGVYFIANDINDMFETGGKFTWQQRCFAEIAENYGEYLKMLAVACSHVDGEAFRNYVTGKVFDEECESVITRLCSGKSGVVYENIAADLKPILEHGTSFDILIG